MKVAQTDSRISLVHSLVDDLFDSRQAKGYQLALQLGSDGISAAVWDDAFNKIIAFEQYSFQKAHHVNVLLNLAVLTIRQSEVLANPFKKVSLGIVHSKSTLVPNALFDAGEKDALLKFNHTPEDGEITLVDHLPNLDATTIYAVSNTIHQQFREMYPVVNITHCSSPLIETIMLRYKHVEPATVVVHVQSANLQILVVKSGKLMFYNSFAFQSPEDFIYYLLFVFEQLKLNPETVNVELLGDLDKNSAAYKLVYKYIRNVNFGERPGTFDFSFKLASLPKQSFYSLFCQFSYT